MNQISPEAAARRDTHRQQGKFGVQPADESGVIAHTPLPKFRLPGVSDNKYEAVSYGEPWNGFATPVVTKETLQRILNDMDAFEASYEEDETPHRWDGDKVWIGDDETPFEPNTDGLYDTSFLGFTFEEEDHWAELLREQHENGEHDTEEDADEDCPLCVD